MTKTVITEGAANNRVSNPKRDFLLAATNMSWQLAIVVLVPIIGGFKIDQHLNDVFPVGTILGFILAMIGMGLVVWRQLQMFSLKITSKVDTK